MHADSRPIRRAVDIVAAAAAAAILLPAALIAAVAIALVMGRPIFFRQTRIGKNERPFELYKFRTMEPDRENNGVASDSHRLTPLGRWLRNWSLDEVPQLWNVFKGDMTLVGPRPLLPQYLPRYTATQRRRHEVKPGVTGWAQVNGRNALGWDEKFRLDVWYVDNRSGWLDCKILLLTVRAVLYRRGVTADGYVTAAEFQGSVAQE